MLSIGSRGSKTFGRRVSPNAPVVFGGGGRVRVYPQLGPFAAGPPLADGIGDLRAVCRRRRGRLVRRLRSRDRSEPGRGRGDDRPAIDIGGKFPKPWTDETVRAADVVITMSCGDACPIFPGKRYEDWPVADPAGQDLDTRPHPRRRGAPEPGPARRAACAGVRRHDLWALRTVK
jgi:hypothetical protein